MIEAPLEINGFKFHITLTMTNDGVLVDPTTMQINSTEFLEAFKIVCDMFPAFRGFLRINLWDHAPSPYNKIEGEFEEGLKDIIEWGELAMSHPRVVPFMTERPHLIGLIYEAKKELERRKLREEQKARKAARKAAKRDGFVYLIRANTGHFKIGRTRKPDDRIATFGVKLPFEVEYLAVIQTPDMYQLEADLHNQYSDKRVNGEWFNLLPDDVAYIQSLAGGV